MGASEGGTDEAAAEEASLKHFAVSSSHFSVKSKASKKEYFTV